MGTSSHRHGRGGASLHGMDRAGPPTPEPSRPLGPSQRRVIRRYRRAQPGELVHLISKKIGRIPPSGGWRVRGRGAVKGRRVGYTYLHVALDDRSRVAYVEAFHDERADTLIGFWRRAQDWFWARGIVVEEVLTGDGPNLRSAVFDECVPCGPPNTASPSPTGPRPTARSNAPPDHGR